MTTANHAPAMPIVHARPTFVEIHRRAGIVDIVTMFATGQPDVDAAEIRGCIADAYRVGLADGLARTNQENRP